MLVKQENSYITDDSIGKYLLIAEEIDSILYEKDIKSILKDFDNKTIGFF
ncbi:hypothetical protein J43TS3_16850 [Ornithinibacillus bavariensis]|uniref:Uncharacterized protein n=1 Tax=Ornithinibacillus bavariensis TaxID=545502 RepID=A0A919X8N8_9BACI|nr:hypothetical protein J43TS3_16850 [Ornithinibacillus bavariensis]